MTANHTDPPRIADVAGGTLARLHLLGERLLASWGPFLTMFDEDHD